MCFSFLIFFLFFKGVRTPHPVWAPENEMGQKKGEVGQKKGEMGQKAGEMGLPFDFVLFIHKMLFNFKFSPFQLMEQDVFFMPSESKKGLEVIKKDNRLIEAKYKLSINEQRLVLAVLGMIRVEDTELGFYKINIKDLAEFHGLQSSKDLYAQIHNAAEQLLVKPLDISTGKRVRKVTWLNYIDYKEGEGVLIVDFHSALKPYLLQLKSNFTQYQLAAVVNFKNSYSIRFYEFLRMRSGQGKGGRFYIQFSIVNLKEMLGIDQLEYKNTKDLRVRVIEPALREVDAISDIAIVDVQYIKKGRAIAEIKIIAELKKQRALPIPKQPEPAGKETHPIIESLISLGFSPENAKAYKIKHGIKKIERNIAYTLAKKQDGEVKNLPAYLNRAIEDDWGSAWESERVKEAEKKKQIQLKEKQKKSDEVRQADEKRKANDAFIDDFFLLPDDEREAMEKDFLDSLDGRDSKKQRAVFAELGENAIRESKVTRVLFLHFLKTNFGD